MKPVKEGYRIAVVGASSLLGKELMSVLEQGKFPVSRLLTFETDDGEPELPIIDLGHASAAVVEDGQIRRGGTGLHFPRRTRGTIAGFSELLAAARERRAVPGY